MRRGLIHWNHEELPPAAIDARVARLQAAMREEGLGAVCTYASFAQPAPLQWLCNYVPYWSEAVLVVWPEGPPALLVAGTPRTHGWIRSVSHSGELIAAPRPGVQLAELLGRTLPAPARVGVVALDQLPWSFAEPLLAAGWGERLLDATALYRRARQPGDEAERGLARRAAAIAAGALAAIPANAAQASTLLAAVDLAARSAGAEEVLLRIAPDLARDATLQRMEGDAPLGTRYAVDCSLAYKGVWVRDLRSFTRSGEPPASWVAALDWFERAQAQAGTADDAALALGCPGTLSEWALEASVGQAPLDLVAGSALPAAAPLPAGSLAVFSARLALEDGPWRCATGLVLGHGALAAGA
jgi:hypothetical protein